MKSSGERGTPAGIEDVARPHGRKRDHRQTGRHGLEQDKSLRLGARGKDEDVGGGIAVRQVLLPIEIAEEADASGDPRGLDLRPQRGQCRTFPGHQQRGLGRRTERHLQRAQQEIDVLFVGHAADEKRHQPLRANAVARAENLAIAAAEALGGMPVGSTCIGAVTP